MTDYDDVFNEYEDLMEEQDKKQQQQQKAVKATQSQMGIKPQQNEQFQQVAKTYQSEVKKEPQNSMPQKVVSSLVDFEQQFTLPQEFKSFMLLKHEINTLQNGCLKQKFVLDDPIQLNFYKKLVQQLETKLKLMVSFVEQGKLQDIGYIKFIKEAFKEQSQQLKNAQNQANQLFIKRIEGRLSVLGDEMKKFQQNSPQAFIWVIKQVSPQTQIPDTQKPDPKATYQLQKEKREQQKEQPLSQFKSDMTVEQFIEKQIDEKPIHIKYEFLLRRYKQYHNYASYLAQNVSEKKELLNTQIFPLLEKGKFTKQEFINGKNPSISNFLSNELKELTFEEFYGMTPAQYKDKINSLFSQLFDANNEEKKFQKIAMHSKPVIVKGKGQQISAFDDSKMRLQSYSDNLYYIKSLKEIGNIWIPLPKIEVEQVTTQLCLENKEIEANRLVIRVKRLLETKVEKYYIAYTLESDGKIIQNKTEVCNQSGVFDYKEQIITNNKDFNLSGRNIEFKIFEKGLMFGASEVGMASLSLEKLKNSHTLETTIQFNGKKTIKLEVGLYVREPIEKFQNLTIPFTHITLRYPEFDKEKGVKEYLEENIKFLPSFAQVQELQRQKEEQQKKQELLKQQEKELQSKNQIEEEPKVQESQDQQWILLNHMENSKEIQSIKAYVQANTIIPEGLTEQDLLYPENPEKSTVFNFIEPYVQFVEQQLNIVRAEPSLRQQSKFVQKMWEDYLRWKMQVENRLKREDYDWYISRVKNLLPREQALIQIYSQLGLQEWVQFVEMRKQILEQELKEFESM